MALQHRPKKTRELVAILGLHRVTLWRKLEMLKRLGLIVQRLDRRWQAVVRLVVAPWKEAGESPLGGLLTALEPARDARQKAEGPAPAPPESVSPTGSLRVSQAFSVPVGIEYLGWVSVRTEAACRDCGKTTRLRYGQAVVCGECARRRERVSKQAR